MSKTPVKLDILKQSIVRRISLGLNLLSLYPPFHPEVNAGINMLLHTLEPYFMVEEEFVIGVGPRGWIVKDTNIDRENLQFGGTARELHRRGISAIAIHSGITGDTLLNFFQIAVMSVEQLEKKGGIINCIANVRMPNLNVFQLDYSKLVSTDEALGFDSIELFFKQDNLESIITNYETNVVNNPAHNPEEIAIFLNNINKMKDERHADAIIKFVTELGTRCVKNFLVKSKSKPDKLFQLLSQLNPDIINKVTTTLKSSKASNVVDISSEEVEYDPYKSRLVNLFNSFSAGSPDIQFEVSENETEQLVNIFENKAGVNIDASVNYKTFINNAVDKTGLMIRDSSQYKNKHENFLHEISDVNIEKQYLSVLLDLMDLETIPTDYKMLYDNVCSGFSKLTAGRCYSQIFEVFSFLDRHSVVKEDMEIKSIAADGLDTLFAGNVVYDILETWLSDKDCDEVLIEKLLVRLNRSMVITQLKLLLFSVEDQLKKEKISALLSKIVSTDLSVFDEDIEGADNTRILSAIDVIRRTPTSDSAEILGKLLLHSDREIREKAMEGLLQHATQQSLKIILSIINDLSDVSFELAINAVTTYGQEQVIQLLLPMLNKTDLFGRTYQRRMKIIKVCGENKNVHSIPILVKIFHISPFLFKAKNNSMRAAILNSLSKIGTRDALMAVSLLSQSGDTIIQLTGDILLEKGKKTRG